MRYILDDIMDRVPEPFNLVELMGKVEELTPFTIVALQECERMNRLMGEIRRSLKELELGLKVKMDLSLLLSFVNIILSYIYCTKSLK